jgi:hypothetical protein
MLVENEISCTIPPSVPSGTECVKCKSNNILDIQAIITIFAKIINSLTDESDELLRKEGGKIFGSGSR